MIAITFEEHGDVIVFTIAGEFFIESVESAEKTWNQIVQKQPRVVGIDCHEIKFIDSSAIGVLVKFPNNSTKLNIQLIFFDLNETIFNVFKTAKLGNFFTIMDKEQFRNQFLK